MPCARGARHTLAQAAYVLGFACAHTAALLFYPSERLKKSPRLVSR